MDSWIGTWWSIQRLDSEAWLRPRLKTAEVRLWGVGWVSCSVIRYRPCSSFLTHTVYTHRPSQGHRFGGGQIWIWRMGTIGDNLQKFKKFLKNCHKMFRGMVEPDKSLISTLAFLSSCSCQFRHPCQFCCFWKFRQSLQFLFTFKNFKTFSNFKNVKKLDTLENFYAVDIFDNALVSQNIKFRHPCQFCHFWKFRQFFHFKKCWHF